jgi:ABC-type glycerol-3-phosphate transport system permease component
VSKLSYMWKEIPLYFTITFLLGLSLFPIYFIAVNSLKTTAEFARSVVALPSHLQWSNFFQAWLEIGQPIGTSAIISVMSTLGVLTFASLSAYAFAFVSFLGKEKLYNLVFVLLLVPGFLMFIPLYLQIKSLGLTNSPLSLILPYIASGQAFAILSIKAFFEQIPRELLESARIDGAGHLTILSKVVLPLSMPILISVGIVNIVAFWNDYLLPSLLLDREHRTVAMALAAFQGNSQSAFSSAFGVLFAGYALASIPLVIFFSFLLRYYVDGLTSGSVKG